MHLNSWGRGKGLAVYYKEDKFILTDYISTEKLQLSVFESNTISVICFYRSQNDTSLNKHLLSTIPVIGDCLVIGDFNICSMVDSSHEVFKTLRSMGFIQMTSESTHFAGGHIDQAWLRNSLDSKQASETELYSPFFNATDHDAILFTYYDPNSEQGRFEI